MNEKKKRSFSVPLIILSMTFLLISFTLQAVYIVGQIRRELRSIQAENFSIIAKSFADMLELEVEGNENQLQGFATVLSSMDDLSGMNYEKLLNKVQNSNRYYETVFYADLSGKVLYSPDKNFLGTDISSREYFQAVAKKGRDTYTTSKALVSRATGNVTIVHAAEVTRNGRTSGLLGATLNLTLLGEELLLRKKIGESGYPLVMDSDGLILIHPDEEIRFTSARDLNPFFADILASSEYEQYTDFRIGGIRKEGVFIRMAGLEWIIGITVDFAEAFSLVNSIRMQFVLSNAAMILLTSFFIFFFVRRNLVRKVTHLEAVMAAAAQGIISERGHVTGRDEIAEMTDYLNTLLDSLSRFFSSLNGNLEALENVGGDLSANMEETASAIHQIRVNVENSQSQIERQEQSVRTTAAAAEQMTRNIQSLDGNIRRQNESIEQGSTAVEEMIDRIHRVSSSADDSEEVMNTLSRSSGKGQEKIRDVSRLAEAISRQSHDLEEANNLITGIAARTNLLAMNAAIEAAHAGSAGRGFAVVADEIRNLAEQSTKQSAQVRETIKLIGNSINEIVDGSRESLHAFEEILSHVQNMGRITTGIKNSMKEQVTGSAQVMDSLKELRDVSSEVQTGSGEMNGGNRNILEAIEELTGISREVALAFKEINYGMEEINRAVIAVSDLTVTNRDSIEDVQREAAHFLSEKSPEEL